MKITSFIFFLLSLVLSGVFPGTARSEESASVLSIIDGDTIRVLYQGEKESVRLIGIDTPEKRVNDKARRNSKATHTKLKAIISQGQQAHSYVAALLKPGEVVRLEFDVQKRDKYGRLLAYVYLSDSVMLNERLLLDGYATLYTFPPNVRFVARFRKAVELARKMKRGLWAE